MEIGLKVKNLNLEVLCREIVCQIVKNYVFGMSVTRKKERREERKLLRGPSLWNIS